MQLVYLYIHKYKGIRHFACPFTSKYLFETVIDKDDNKQIQLTISRNNQHIPDFFADTNTSEATAIVGQNGTGKSSILRWIRKSLDDHNSGFFEHVILGFENDLGELIIESEAGLNLQLSVNSGLMHKHYKVGELSGTLGGRAQGRTLSRFYQNVSTIYYSNTLDYAMRNDLLRTWYDVDDEDSEDSYKFDISTRYLLLHSKRNTGRQSTHKLENFVLDEQKRSVLFGIGQSEYQLPFPVPPVYSLELNLPKNYNGYLNQEINQLLLKISGIREGVSDRFILNLDITLFIGIIHQLPIPGQITEIDVRIKEALDRFSNGLEQANYKSTDHISHLLELSVDDRYSGLFKIDIQYYLTELRPEISKVYEKARDVLDNDFSIYLRQGVFSQDELKGILDLTSNKGVGTLLLNYYWRGLSSGEQAMLSFFSRLYEIRDSVHASNILFLIDEGDAYYHPEWQRSFFSSITSFVSKLFPEKNVQYIFSSNTPFIAADLPKSKVIHIERDANGNSAIATQVTNQTFASNIHTLLSSNFYLSSFLGEFAKKKIEELVVELNPEYKEDVITPERRENIKKLISQIGEPIVKKRLEHLYFEKTGEGTETVEDRIKKLRDEADRLEKGRKKDENS